jgi:hypothetical protein
MDRPELPLYGRRSNLMMRRRMWDAGSTWHHRDGSWS